MPDEAKPNPCPRGTINHHDPDVQQVAAALGDASLGGGLSKGYYRKADEALAGLAGKLHDKNVEIIALRDEVDRLAFVNGNLQTENGRLLRERDAAVCQELERVALEDPTAEQRGMLSTVAITQIRRLLRIESGVSTVAGVRRYMENAERDALAIFSHALGLMRCTCKGSDPACSRCAGKGFVPQK